ncbi:MAG: hypothetical protein LBC91_05835 [Candidatus Accumulibacter sp.]|jgi:hypothetical protein|nr:hypothetical protein [Accumulibacter sp.]
MLKFFSTRPDHPLGEAKELKRVLAGLPQEASKAVDEIHTWFESLRQTDDFGLDRLYEVVDSLDRAAQPHLKCLTRHYLETPRLSKNEERRLWTVCFNYWGEVSRLYDTCIERANRNPKDKNGGLFKGHLPLAATRLMAARSNQIKWINYRYGVIGEDLWCGIGLPYLAAEAKDYSQKPVQIYPGAPGTSCVSLQYLQALVRESSSIGMLLPLEIEMADQLIAYFLPTIVFGKERSPASTYWIDAAGAMPPARLLQQPPAPSPGLRFFQPGAAFPVLEELLHAVERGVTPEKIGLEMENSVPALLKAARHLALYWAPAPPLRGHVRHSVKTRMAVLQGFDNSLAVFACNVARLGVEQSAESWVVDNVSLGGFHADAKAVGDWLTVGSLLCLQPEGGDNWVLGVVRRRSVSTEARAAIGIQTLARNARSVELRARAPGISASAIPGIWLIEDETTDRVRLILPPRSFNVRQSLEFVHKDERHLLTPVELEESGGDFEIGVYREQIVE